MANFGGRTFHSVCIRSLNCWDCGFETSSEHGCSSLLFVKGFFAKLRKATFRVVMSASPSARMEQLGPTGRTFMKHDNWVFFENTQDLLKSDKNEVYLNEYLCTFFIISHWILLRMRNFSDKSCREYQSTFLIQHFSPKIVPFMR
jgi:hypothetical protein